MRLFFISLFSLCLSGIASAQTTELTISGAFDFWQPQFHSGNYRFSKDNGFQHECLGAAVAAAVPVKNGFYLGAEAGIHSGSYFMDHTITATQSTAEFSHLGYYEVNQFQVFLVPEYRFLRDDLLFVKGGLGICKDFNTRFTNGVEVGLGSVSSDLVGRSYPRQIAAGGFIGGGLQIKLVKRLGLKLEGRYTIAPHGAESDDQIIYRFNYLSAVGGLTFTL